MLFRKKKSKYNNLSCRCLSGHIHDSRGEAQHCNNLRLLVKAGEIKSYSIQVKCPLYVNEKLICNHYVDFKVIGNDGREWIEEYKGFATSTWNIKRKLFEAIHPDIEYKVIKHK